jgi:hypothetical protein
VKPVLQLEKGVFGVGEVAHPREKPFREFISSRGIDEIFTVLCGTSV